MTDLGVLAQARTVLGRAETLSDDVFGHIKLRDDVYEDASEAVVVAPRGWRTATREAHRSAAIEGLETLDRELLRLRDTIALSPRNEDAIALLAADRAATMARTGAQAFRQELVPTLRSWDVNTPAAEPIMHGPDWFSELPAALTTLRNHLDDGAAGGVPAAMA